MDERIKDICEAVEATEPPTLYLTGDEKLWRKVSKQRKREGLPVEPFKPNFRIAVATSKPYKGNRKSEKPYHFDNVRAYMLGAYNVEVANGIEADDLMSIHQTRSDVGTTIICSRDKDLRITPGWHYGWECGRQPEFGPELVDELGWLTLNSNKLKGVGKKFFYSQMLTGDTVDNIPGLPKYGPVKAYNLLHGLETEEQCEYAVRCLYKEKIGEDYEDYYNEQHALLWMLREMPVV